VTSPFNLFITPEVTRRMQDNDLWDKGHVRDVPVFFADVRQFTPFAESVAPKEATTALNEVLAEVIGAVHRHGGIVNKFTGDGILALFGAPIPNTEHVPAAARAAVEAVAAVEALAVRREAAGKKSLRIGIGMNTGEVLAGALGTSERAEYSVIGHAVNLASRLEGASGPGEIWVGPRTAEVLATDFKIHKPDPCQFPGITGLTAPSLLVAGPKR
jgi:adenylate cyclase